MEVRCDRLPFFLTYPWLMSAEAPSRRSRFALILAGILIGALGMLTIGIADASRRVALLSTLDFRTERPPVPDNVMDAVLGAELKFYEDMGFVRRKAEDLQDALGLVWPRLAFAGDFSVGNYRIKASTVYETLDFAVDNDYLVVDSNRAANYDEVVPFFALQPSFNDWQASVLLERLRLRHPQLRDRSWNDIASDPNAIAKLYSGYMGAGGDWQRWESDMVPGQVSRYRLGFDAASGGYSGIRAPGSRRLMAGS